MKQQKLRFRVLTLLVVGMLIAASAYGGYSVTSYGSRWVSSTRNTRYRSAKSSVTPGDIIDRNGVVVALLALDRAGRLNGAAVKQKLLGQRGLARVGVRNDGKCAATIDLGRKLLLVHKGRPFQSPEGKILIQVYILP